MRSDRRSSVPVAVACLLGLALAAPAGAQDVPEGSDEAILEFAQGMKLYMAGQGPHAMQHFLAAHELDPDFALALYFAGIQAVNAGDRAAADSLYALAEAMGDRLSPYYRARIRSSRASAQGDMATALAQARIAAEVAPGSKAAYNYALYANRQGRPAEALAALQGLDPDRHPFLDGYNAYWAQLATAHHRLGQFEEELAVVEEWSERFGAPRSVRMVGALAALGRVDEALRHTEEDYARGGGWAIPSFVAILWSELEAHGHAEAAGEIRREWLQRMEGLLREGDPDDRNFYAWALMGEGRDDEALALLRELAEDAPGDLQARSWVGLAAARAGDMETAREVLGWLDGYTGRTPPTPALEWQGLIHAGMGHGEVAVDHLRRALAEGVYFNTWWHREPVLIALADDPAVRAFFGGGR